MKRYTVSTDVLYFPTKLIKTILDVITFKLSGNNNPIDEVGPVGWTVTTQIDSECGTESLEISIGLDVIYYCKHFWDVKNNIPYANVESLTPAWRFMDILWITSISKYVDLYKAIKYDCPELEDIGWMGETCVLCEVYANTDGWGECGTCPIAVRSHKNQCFNTPWVEMSRSIKALTGVFSSEKKVTKEHTLKSILDMANYINKCDWSR